MRFLERNKTKPGNTAPDKNSPEYWEQLLASEGLPSEPLAEQFGTRVPLGDGLGRKTDREEDVEDYEGGHAKMCPINLGKSIGGSRIDQPNDRPVEE